MSFLRNHFTSASSDTAKGQCLVYSGKSKDKNEYYKARYIHAYLKSEEELVGGETGWGGGEKGGEGMRKQEGKVGLGLHTTSTCN